MSVAITVISIAACAYIVGLAVYLRLKNASGLADQLVRSEHRVPQPSSVLSALAAVNPAYRFRRYSDDERLVTRIFTDSRSALADESR